MPLLPPNECRSHPDLDERFLARALELANAAVGLASPNPTVGCVLACGETVLGEGAHHYNARDHAEIVALRQAAGQDLRGATAYVTLEPCSHHGRTGPCSDALIAAGIRRCIVATVDPNPAVRGAGIAKLRDAGAEVLVLPTTAPLAHAAQRLNDAFAQVMLTHRPFVTLKAALSVDGKLAPPPSIRQAIAPHWLTGAAARSDAQRLRHTNDAILTGIGTVLADNPSLTDRTRLPRRRPLLRVVLDSSLRIPLNSTLVTTADSDVLVLCSESAFADREAALWDCGVEVVRLPSASGHLDLSAALKALTLRSVLGVLVEAGATLNGSLLRANLVDKLVLYFAETELGVGAVPFAADFDSPYVLQQRLTGITRATFPSDRTSNTEDVRVTGYLHDPWSMTQTH